MSVMKIKWILVENAPLTASGQDEILAGAKTKDGVRAFARYYGITDHQFRTGQYSVIKVAPDKPVEKEKAMQVGSPEHDQFVADQTMKMALKDEEDRLADEEEARQQKLEIAYYNLTHNSKKEN